MQDRTIGSVCCGVQRKDLIDFIKIDGKLKELVGFLIR